MIMKSEDISLRKTSICITEGCGHASRDHSLWKKMKSGHYTGGCLMPDCKCKQYMTQKMKDDEMELEKK